MDDSLLKVEEVAVLIGMSSNTIDNWYRWARQNKDNEYAKMLPNYVQNGNRQTRYWRSEDLWKLNQFKNALPQGRGGIMASVTQKYCKNKRRDING